MRKATSPHHFLRTKSTNPTRNHVLCPCTMSSAAPSLSLSLGLNTWGLGGDPCRESHHSSWKEEPFLPRRWVKEKDSL